jgi:hypothetical protein
MDKYINYICEYFQKYFYSVIREPIKLSLEKYFGIKDQATTDQALSDLDRAFVTGTGINKAEIVPIEAGEYRFKYRLEFTIKAEYVGMIAVLAAWLGFIETEGEE